jgi:hypothetical protein
MCPECKTDVVGTLLDDGALRCDWRLLGWRSVLVGKDKSGKDEYDYIPQTETGCGGTLRLCAHGLRVCAGLPPCDNFTPPAGSHVVTMSLADAMRADVERANARKELGRMQKKAQEHPSFVAPSGRVQIPFLGDAEPERWTPPKSRKKKDTR